MKSKQIWIKAGFSLIFIVFLANASDIDLVADMLKKTDLAFVALSLLLSIAMIAVSSGKWRICLGERADGVSFSEMMKLYFIGYYFSNLLPSNVGGDVARSYLLGINIGSQGHAAVSVFIERFTGILFLLFMVILSPLAQPKLYDHPAIWIPALVSAGLLIFFGLYLFAHEPTRIVQRIFTLTISRLIFIKSLKHKALSLWDRFCGRLTSFYCKLNQALTELRYDRRRFLYVSLSTVIFYAMTWFNVYLAFRVFGIDPLWENIIAVTATAVFVSMIPIAPLGGLGLMEASLTGYFALVGMDPASSLVMALFIRFKIVLIGILGFIFFLHNRQELTRIS